MIYAVGTGIPDSHRYVQTTFKHFLDWIVVQDAYQLDVETNITRTRLGRLLRTVQFGEVRKSFESPGIRFVVHWLGISPEEQQQLLEIVAKRGPRKYIHNALFEYETFLNYNVVLENVRDTMLGEMIKWTGYQSIDDEDGNNFYSLAGCMSRYFNILLDKTYQTLFVFEFELTDGHIVYAADDVSHLDMLDSLQTKFLREEGLINVQNLENEAVLAFGDITWNGILIDQEKWLANLDLAEPVLKRYKENLDQWLLTDAKLNKYAKEHGHIYTEDTVEFSITNPTHKSTLAKRIFPDIAGGTKPILKAYLREQYEKIDQKMYDLLLDMFNGDWVTAFEYLIDTDKDWLIEQGYVVPAGTIRINWNSQTQVLPMFQAIDKKLKDLSEKSRNTFEHPIVHDFEQYKSSLKLISSYGQAFLDKYVDLDGRVRTRFNQILQTGRISSSNPNVQNIPILDDDDPIMASRYRRAFHAQPGWVFVGSDYSSQELCLLAYMSQEPVWLDALKNGKDLHSVCAALIYGKDWDIATEPGCVFKTEFQKCKCKGHKKMRQAGKNLDFGLSYGMSEFKLAGALHISVAEARDIMERFFKALPAIDKLLTNLGGYGIQTGIIKTLAPFNRKRWFPEWARYQGQIQEHLMNIRYNGALGRIGRQSRNTPIQGSAADMVKLALVKIRRYINDNNLRDKVRLSMQVHDEIVCECREDYSTQWAFILNQIMEEAAKVIIPSGLLKADTSIDLVWTK